MPDYCFNKIALFGEPKPICDALMLKRLSCQNYEQNGGIFEFEHYVPIGTWEYTKAKQQWGTKWGPSNVEVTTHKKMVTIRFDTAWEPANTGVFRAIVKTFCIKKARYVFFEPMGDIFGEYKWDVFCGTLTSLYSKQIADKAAYRQHRRRILRNIYRT